jgi:predicted kinase
MRHGANGGKPVTRRLVYVSGAPGAGKSSLAAPLAAELGYPLVYKDKLKETLHEVLGGADADRAWSRRLGAAAMELIWAVAADAPHAVIEANFRPHSEYERHKLTGLADRIVEVYCACPPDLALRRYNQRGPSRHRVHVNPVLTLEELAEWDQPVGVGELITVDTTAPVDVINLAGQVRCRMEGRC